MRPLLMLSCTIGALALCANSATAGNVLSTIMVSPAGLPANASLDSIEAAVDPLNILRHPESGLILDQNNRVWVIETKPLTTYLTDLSLQLRRGNERLHPEIVLELPRKALALSLYVPIVGEVDQGYVRSVYAGEYGDMDEAGLITALVRTEHLIRYLQGEELAEDVPASAVLARALVVYAETLDTLIRRTEWFGRPRSLSDRRQMLRRVQTAIDGEHLQDVNGERIRQALRILSNADHHMYTRIWNASILAATDCLDRLPLLKALYHEMRAMPAKQYEDMKALVGVPRTEVLLGTTECFRKLISVDGERRFALPHVIEEGFGGESAEALAEAIRGALLDEVWSLAPSAGGEPMDACQGANPRELLGRLCRSIAYLDELQELLVDGSVVQTVSTAEG